MSIWSEIKDIQLDLSGVTDEAIHDMLKTMSPADRQKIIEDLRKEIQENKNLTKTLHLALRLASIVVAAV
jgi:hypothetical protein